MSDMVDAKEKAVLKTIELLNMTKLKVYDELPPMMKKSLRTDTIKRIADLWNDDVMREAFPVYNRIRDLALYSEYDMLYKFKLAECINSIRCMTQDEPTKLFNLN